MALTNEPNLIDGAVYSLLYVAFDPAGNQSDTVRVDHIFYDVTPPAIVITYPESNIFTTETKLLFEISEDIYDFMINWGGLSSDKESHPVEFIKLIVCGAPRSSFPLVLRQIIWALSNNSLLLK